MNDELRKAIEWARKQAADPAWRAESSHRFALLADVAERSIDPPTVELRCPYCHGAHVIVTTYNGKWCWLCRNMSCWASGPLKPTEEEARESAEERHGSDVS